MQVFNSFLNLGYVAKEVKGNERSIIKVIHSTAKKNADEELGKFVSFDELYNNMFEEGLQARGQRAVDNAIRMARQYENDPNMAVRVANILFMICNISQTDQLLFPANIDNVTTLLVKDVTTPRLTIKNDVEKILDYLCDNNIIRREPGQNGTLETYTFYSEEEMKVAQLIQCQVVDNNTQAEMLREIFFKYLSSLRNKEKYLTRTFAVGASIKQRQFLSNSPDVVVEFAVDVDYDSPDSLAPNNAVNKMVYYIAPQLGESKKLQNAFYWYCQVNRYMSTPASSDENANTRREFEQRAKELFENIIAPGFQKILDTCPIISGMRILDEVELGNKRGDDRFHIAIQKHLASIYTKGSLVDRPDMPNTTDALKKAILRPINPGDYDGMRADLTAAEHEVEIYLDRQYAEVNVADVTSKFTKEPYGWDPLCTLYIINELVRRHRRDYSYSNNPNVDTNLVASRLVQEMNKFTLRKAKVISQELINKFIAAWKDIFGVTEVFSTNDSTQLFRLCREPENSRSLTNIRDTYRKLEAEIGAYPFAEPIHQAIDLFDEWLSERDPQRFFEAIVAKQKEARDIIDKCREVVQFSQDQLPTYKKLCQFATDNEYNFPFVSEDCMESVDEFVKIVDDPWPIKKLRDYMKLYRELENSLEEARSTFRDQIRKAYNEQFDYLERVAGEQNVPVSVLANREDTISSKTASDNILMLKNNISIEAFYKEQIGRILDYASKHNPKTSAVTGEDSDADTVPSTPQKRIRQASLQTKTSIPLSTEEDIDHYLKGLKEQIIKMLVDYDSIMIIK